MLPETAALTTSIDERGSDIAAVNSLACDRSHFSSLAQQTTPRGIDDHQNALARGHSFVLDEARRAGRQ